MAHIQHLDDLVKEYLLFRGFSQSLKTFENDLKIDKDKGFRVDRLTDQIMSYIQTYDLQGLRDLWNHFDRRIFTRLSPSMQPYVRKLETSVLRLYVVNTLQTNKIDKLHEFFDKMAPELQTSPEWRDWFVLPYLKGAEDNPTFAMYFSRQWQDTLMVSLTNFLSVVFQNLQLPTLARHEEESEYIRSLQEEAEQLRVRLNAALSATPPAPGKTSRLLIIGDSRVKFWPSESSCSSNALVVPVVNGTFKELLNRAEQHLNCDVEILTIVGFLYDIISIGESPSFLKEAFTGATPKKLASELQAAIDSWKTLYPKLAVVITIPCVPDFPVYNTLVAMQYFNRKLLANEIKQMQEATFRCAKCISEIKSELSINFPTWDVLDLSELITGVCFDMTWLQRPSSRLPKEYHTDGINLTYSGSKWLHAAVLHHMIVRAHRLRSLQDSYVLLPESSEAECQIAPDVAPITSNSAQITSSSAQITSSSAQITSPSAHITSTSAQITSPSAQITSPSAQITSPSAKITSADPQNFGPGSRPGPSFGPHPGPFFGPHPGPFFGPHPEPSFDPHPGPFFDPHPGPFFGPHPLSSRYTPLDPPSGPHPDPPHCRHVYSSPGRQPELFIIYESINDQLATPLKFEQQNLTKIKPSKAEPPKPSKIKPPKLSNAENPVQKIIQKNEKLEGKIATKKQLKRQRQRLRKMERKKAQENVVQ